MGAASKGNVTEGTTSITYRFKFTRGRMVPPEEKCSRKSCCCLLCHCFPCCFFLMLLLENQVCRHPVAVSPAAARIQCSFLTPRNQLLQLHNLLAQFPVDITQSHPGTLCWHCQAAQECTRIREKRGKSFKN